MSGPLRESVNRVEHLHACSVSIRIYHCAMSLYIYTYTPHNSPGWRGSSHDIPSHIALGSPALSQLVCTSTAMECLIMCRAVCTEIILSRAARLYICMRQPGSFCSLLFTGSTHSPKLLFGSKG